MDFTDNFIQGLFVGLFRLVLGAGLLITPFVVAFQWKNLDRNEKRQKCVAYIILIIAYFAVPSLVHWVASMSIVTGILILVAAYLVGWFAYQIALTKFVFRIDQALDDIRDLANRARNKSKF